MAAKSACNSGLDRVSEPAVTDERRPFGPMRRPQLMGRSASAGGGSHIQMKRAYATRRSGQLAAAAPQTALPRRTTADRE
jgi:hypothetical protein